MANKQESMNNFQNALNASKKREAEKKKEEMQKEREMQEEQKRENARQEPTNNQSEQNEEEPKQTEEEKQQEEQKDKRDYSIYDDDDENYEDDEDNKNNPNNRYRNNNKKNKDDEDEDDKDDENNDRNTDEQKDNNQNKNKDELNDNASSEMNSQLDNNQTDDSNNNIDDDKQSATNTKAEQSGKDSSGKESGSSENGTNQGSVENSTGSGANTSSGANAGTSGGAGTAEAETAGAAASAGAAEAGAGATEAGTTAGTAAAGASTAPLWIIILVLALVIVIVIIVIGYASFFYNGAGIIRDKILEYANGIWVDLKGFFGNNPDEAKVTDEQIGNIATYLENMGYDLPNYGFLDNDKGMPFTSEMNDDGTGVIKNSDGDVVYEKVKNEETGNIEVKKIKSKYIKAYLAAENNTYMIANQNGSIKDLFQSSYNEDWGTGMIHLENLGDDNNIKKYVEIDRENKKMIITYNDYVYQYDLDGWTGRYGKSIEFLLTMHLATMAPDFVYDIVKDDDFNTKVNIALYPTTAKINIQTPNEGGELVTIDESNYSQFGLTYEQWEAIAEYTAGDPETGLIETFTPFITNLKKHWYKDLDFTACYVESENNPDTTEDDEGFTSVYEYVGLEENDPLANVDIDLYVQEIRQKDIFQISEPKVKKNGKIKEMLLGKEEGTGAEENAQVNVNEEYKYFIYNGSTIPDEGLKKQYIINKVNLPESEKNPEYVMNTRTFTHAFAILESVHSEDAEYALRDLKELFQDVGVYADDEQGSTGSDGETKPEVLTWPIKGYKPVVWDPIYNAETSKVVIRHKTTTTLGFEPDMEVLMPANGEIVSISEEKPTNENGEEELEESLGNIVKIRLTGDDKESLEDMYIYISGIEVNEEISEGQKINSGETIGKTIGRDISIIMTDSKRKAIQNVDQYFVPEAWDVLVETDEIQDSQFGGDVLDKENEDGTIQVEGDHNVNTTSGENVINDKEKIIAALDWYRQINPNGYYNIVNNIDYFMQIQNQYKVNAIFGIAVAITESGAGTTWDYIAPYTYNWMSLAGSYNGVSYNSNRAWRWYSSFGEATLDFGNWIATSTYYFNAGKNTVSQIAPTYCDVRWGNTVNDNMSKILSNIQ